MRMLGKLKGWEKNREKKQKTKKQGKNEGEWRGRGTSKAVLATQKVLVVGGPLGR